MTKDQAAEAILKRKLPPDHLDSKWGLVMGQLPISIPLIIFIWEIIISPDKLNNGNLKILILIFAVLQFISLYFLFTNRSLKFIETGNSKEENDHIVEVTLKSLNWKYLKLPFRVDANLPFAFGQSGYLLKVLTDDKGIYYNIRNIGTSRGRLPYLFGFETLMAQKFKRKIKVSMT